MSVRSAKRSFEKLIKPRCRNGATCGIQRSSEKKTCTWMASTIVSVEMEALNLSTSFVFWLIN